MNSDSGAPGETRTHDLQVRNLTLYPLSYGRTWRCLRSATEYVAEREGFEPSEQVTPLGGLANRCTRPLCDLSVAALADDTSIEVDARSRAGYRRSTDVRHLSVYLPGMTAPGA